MKKKGILHSQLAGAVAALGHKDLVLVGDAGMPVPSGVPLIDLALCQGVPTFCQVLDRLLDEMEVEYYYMAEEIKENNKSLHDYMLEALSGADHEYILHDELKQKSRNVKFAVRTGEFTPYPNVILQAGVVF